jgi:hypothetical protein
MLVDFLKGNHLRVAATLSWLWVCLAIGQGRSQGVPGSMAGPGSPTITGSQVRGPKRIHLRMRRRPVQLRGGQNKWPQGSTASGRHQNTQRKGRQGGVSADSARAGGTGANHGLAGPAPAAPATVVSERGLVTPADGGDGTGAAAPQGIPFSLTK